MASSLIACSIGGDELGCRSARRAQIRLLKRSFSIDKWRVTAGFATQPTVIDSRRKNTDDCSDN